MQAVTLPVHPRPFSILEYRKLWDLGIFEEHARIELMEGHIVERDPVTPAHAACVSILAEAFYGADQPEYRVRLGQSLLLEDQTSLVQPDVGVVAHRRDWYAFRHPIGADLFVVCEVAFATVDLLRGYKCSLYAKAGIPEYWIVNLMDRQVEIYTQPAPKGIYLQTRVYQEADTIEHPLLGTHRVADLLPVAMPAQQPT